MTCQGAVEVATYGGSDASLLAQHIDRFLALADSLRTAVRVRLASIPSADEALRELGIIAFVTSHLLFAGGRHYSAVAELLRLI